MTATANGLFCNLPGVEKLHALLVDSFSKHIDGTLSIKCTNFEASLLKEGRINGLVAFDLVSTKGTTLQAERRWGTPAAPLAGFDENASEYAWVSWHEEWKKTLWRFELMNAGFTFAWGRPTNVRDTLFRAEWEQCGSQNAAHPHWHVDMLLPDSDISLSRLHFGMSGWNGDAAFPKCWQTQATRSDEVLRWAERSLEYARQQICDFLPTQR